jgi:hypothetical protein
VERRGSAPNLLSSAHLQHPRLTTLNPKAFSPSTDPLPKILTVRRFLYCKLYPLSARTRHRETTVRGPNGLSLLPQQRGVAARVWPVKQKIAARAPHLLVPEPTKYPEPVLHQHPLRTSKAAPLAPPHSLDPRPSILDYRRDGQRHETLRCPRGIARRDRCATQVCIQERRAKAPSRYVSVAHGCKALLTRVRQKRTQPRSSR